MRQLTEDVLLLQRINQLALIFIGDQIAAVVVLTDFQHVVDLVRNGLVAHRVPEGALVLI